MFNLPFISGDWSIEEMSNIEKKNQALLWYSNGESDLSLLDSLALGFYSDAEFLVLGSENLMLISDSRILTAIIWYF